eukprot:TRINITY_DN4478_c0_g1_i1.p1 TRINITY_DN4478_c0_g1~~TRINITY_DN4478_c0_g1_i1.p1  ORF type:complete len:189 (+),score=23.65 TRINITY_DN4478_c0_g1_i1:13-579(+)
MHACMIIGVNDHYRISLSLSHSYVSGAHHGNPSTTRLLRLASDCLSRAQALLSEPPPSDTPAQGTQGDTTITSPTTTTTTTSNGSLGTATYPPPVRPVGVSLVDKEITARNHRQHLENLAVMRNYISTQYVDHLVRYPAHPSLFSLSLSLPLCFCVCGLHLSFALSLSLSLPSDYRCSRHWGTNESWR